MNVCLPYIGPPLQFVLDPDNPFFNCLFPLKIVFFLERWVKNIFYLSTLFYSENHCNAKIAFFKDGLRYVVHLKPLFTSVKNVLKIVQNIRFKKKLAH